MRNTLFADTGVHAIVDGQYGSTGKGVLAAWLAEQPGAERISANITNAGPNSGHTFYHEGEKHVLKQLPTFAVKRSLMGFHRTDIFLSAGAAINPDVLAVEAAKYSNVRIFVHPNAAWLSPLDADQEHSGPMAAVAGTRSGTGAVIARKVMRDPGAVAHYHSLGGMPPNVFYYNNGLAAIAQERPVVMEVSQGFSLGLNDPRFYPKVTSRECTVMQGISDARIPPRLVSRTYMSCRTYPIRVGDVDGYSAGPWYPDQKETTWEALGQTPEITTVTQRVRRVATFSPMQFRDAVLANDPDFVFMNFLNYLTPGEGADFLDRLRALRDDCDKWFDIIGCVGPNSEDVCNNVDEDGIPQWRKS